MNLIKNILINKINTPIIVLTSTIFLFLSLISLGNISIRFIYINIPIVIDKSIPIINSLTNILLNIAIISPPIKVEEDIISIIIYMHPHNLLLSFLYVRQLGN